MNLRSDRLKSEWKGWTPSSTHIKIPDMRLFGKTVNKYSPDRPVPGLNNSDSWLSTEDLNLPLLAPLQQFCAPRLRTPWWYSMKPPTSGVPLAPTWSDPSDGQFTKPWQVLAARVGSDGFPTSDTTVLSEVLELCHSHLTAVSTAEIAVLVGRVAATNREQLDTACTILLESVDRARLTAFDWNDVFSALPRIDDELKVNSLECFAFLAEVYRRKYPDSPFPVDIGLTSSRWTNHLSQALFVKWIIVAGTISPTASYVQMPFLAYLRGVEISADSTLIDAFPPGFLSHSTSRMWSNGNLLATLLELADDSSHTAAIDSDEAEAARIAFELLKRPTLNCPELLLGTLVKCTHIVASLARPVAVECLENFWKRAQQKPTEEVNTFLRCLVNLNPGRFSLVVVGALYTRAPEKIAEVVAALDPSLLPAVLEGPPAPFKFHVAHLAWSSDFNAVNWLKQRLMTDETGEVAKEFLLFLILSLCPLDVLQQKLPPGTSHPMRRLDIRPYELWLYLSAIVSNCAKPETLPALDYDQSVEALLAKPRDVFEGELNKLKQACARLLPQLAGFTLLVQPTRDAPSSEPAGPLTFPPSVEESIDGGDAVESALQQEVHRYFAMLYTDEITSDNMLEIMRQFSRAPPASHDFQVFNHMIKLLFHECRFFPKYPLSELAVTAQLMGRMIRDEILVGHGPHGTGHLLAIRCIMEALRKGESSKMFRFGITALQQFVDSRMVCCPDFLMALSTSLPDVRKHFPAYSDYADKCLAVMSTELRRMHYIDRETLATLPLPPPPVIVPHPEFSLSPHRAQINQAVYSPETPQAMVTDGVPPQRPLLLNGKPVSLGGFSLGSVERLLSSDPALTAGVVEPPQWFQDRVAQIFNSLVLTNLDQKAEDLRSSVQADWFPWLALYIVKSRATKETNLHQLYVKLLERLGWSKLMDSVVAITYESINILLSYVDAAKESSSYRTVLKNLGSWLGTITLARNIPLRSKAVDLKMLLFDGYENGRLKALLPLCCKMLEGVGQSRSLRPPNPWTVAIFSLLAEIHSLPGLVTALIFEIEVLFKNLNLQVSDYKGRSNNLIKRPPPSLSSPDFTKHAIPPTAPSLPVPRPTHVPAAGGINAISISNLVATLNGSSSQTPSYPLNSATTRTSHPSELLTATAAKLSDPSVALARSAAPLIGTPDLTDNSNIQTALAADASLVRAFGPMGVPHTEGPMKPRTEATPTLLAGLMQSVVISPALVLFQLKPALKAVVPRAIERAIKEIVQIVAERSVTISCVATKELVCKDFAAEASESLIRRASHLMVASLSGSLALVTCREPLRAAMCQHLRTLLLATSDKLGEDQRLVDQVVGVVAADNMDLGCTLVEQSVIQRALQEIEVTIQKPVLLRRQNKALGSATFLDPEYFSSCSRWPAALPDVLKHRAALTGDQLQVYRDFLTFGPLRRMQSSSTPPNLAPPQLSEAPPPATAAASPPHPVVPPTETAAPQDNGEGETTVLMRVEAALSQIKDIVHEVAFCYPVLSVKVTPDTQFCSPLGAIPECLDVPPCVNASLSILCRLPSCHEVFAAVLAVPACCGTARDPEVALLSVCQRVLKMISDAGTLYRQHQLARGTDVAGLYLEVFLAILDQLARLEKFPRQQFESDLVAWLPQALGERRFGTDVIIGLLRYKLLSFSVADHTLVEQAVASVEKRDTVVFESVLKILNRVATQTAIRVDDVSAALAALKGCRELTSRLPVANDNSEPTSLGALLSRAVVALDNQTPQYFGDARRTVLDAISSALEGTEDKVDTTDMVVTFTQLLDNYATVGGPIVRVRKLPAPCALTPERQQAFASLFDQWTVCALVVGSDRRSKVWAEFFQTLSKQRLLQMDDDTDRFFGGCVDRAIKLASEQPESDHHNNRVTDVDQVISVETPPELDCEGPNMKPIDAFAKMIVAMMRLIDPSQISPVLILQRALSVIARSIHRDAEAAPDSLPQKLYYRLLLSLIWEVGQPGRGLDTYAVPCLLYFASIYQVLNPCECPAFVFCWLELISHRCFMPKMLRHLRGWPHYHRLLVCLLRFMYPFLNQVKLSSGVQALYKGVVRLLLVLLHDFPEFLCEYHVDLCENLPTNSVQMRNLILSSFPRTIKLPDPFMPNLKVDQLPESRRAPHLATHSIVLLLRDGIERLLQKYWETADTKYLIEIIPKLKLTDEQSIKERGMSYDLSLINALLLQVASHASQDHLPFTIGASTTVPLDDAPLEAKMLLFLGASLDFEGRYLLISCISNHLRYPNLHTHYFSCTILWMFQEAGDNTAIQEQITRVLLERLIAHRPHPWGLLITFIELIKNPLFNFWNRPFVHSAPQVQKLFHSVAQTCLGQQSIQGQPPLLMQLEQPAVINPS